MQRPLPKGLTPAPPITDPKLLELLKEQEPTPATAMRPPTKGGAK